MLPSEAVDMLRHYHLMLDDNLQEDGELLR
jgi:hypothetical protein